MTCCVIVPHDSLVGSKCRETEKIWFGEPSCKFPGKVQRVARRKLRMLNNARIVNDLRVPPRRINEIVLEKRAITADTALRLARYFGTSEGFWMGLQADFDLEETRKKLGDKLERDVEVWTAADGG